MRWENENRGFLLLQIHSWSWYAIVCIFLRIFSMKGALPYLFLSRWGIMVLLNAYDRPLLPPFSPVPYLLFVDSFLLSLRRMYLWLYILGQRRGRLVALFYSKSFLSNNFVLFSFSPPLERHKHTWMFPLWKGNQCWRERHTDGWERKMEEVEVEGKGGNWSAAVLKRSEVGTSLNEEGFGTRARLPPEESGEVSKFHVLL
jgi:hypothetical protein